MLVLLSGVSAQTTPAPPLALPPPAMFDESGEQARPLDLNSVQVEVSVSGALARTTMTLGFGNSGNRAVAGNLYLPLPAQATVCAYALDIKGVMVDGVPVPKDTGRQIYETVMRRGIDPGLVEWTKGNVFKTRVFPVPANGSRFVRVSWIAALAGGLAGTPQSYVLPLAFRKTIKDFRVTVEVLKSASKPVEADNSLDLPAFSAWRDGWRTELKASNVLADKDLRLNLPPVASHGLSLARESDGKTWFSWFGPSADLGGGIESAGKGIVAQSISLYWDASASRATANNARIIDTLQRALALWSSNKPVTVHVNVFRDQAEAPRTFAVARGDSRMLADFLSRLDYDGGSRLRDLPLPSKADDLAILVSDGLNNLGELGFPVLSVPLFVLSADAQLNAGRLAGLAAASGGAWIAVVDPALAAARIGRPAFRLISATVLSGNVRDVVVVPGTSEGLLGVSGQLESATARLQLDWGWGARVTKSVTLELSAAEATTGSPSDLLRIVWAQSRLAVLLAAPDADSPSRKAEVTRLGRDFNLVTPDTSLIVLETLDQYLEFNIQPPAKLPELRRQWTERSSELKKADKQKKQVHLDQIIELWRQKVAWWDTTFKYPAGYRWQDVQKEESRGLADRAGPGQPAPAMAADQMSSQEARSLVPEREPAADAKKADVASGAERDQPAQPSISIQAWTPDTPYLRELTAAGSVDKAYRLFLGMKARYQASPAFFMDVGDWFNKAGQRGLAKRIWSDLAEMELENPALLRILAYRLSQVGEYQLAREVFEDVLVMRPEEPQSWRDLALACASLKDYERAITLLWQVVVLPDVNGPDGRKVSFDKTPGVEVVALTELNALIPLALNAGVHLPDIDLRLRKLMDADIRIVLSWDTDNCDMDLWVIEPSGEKAYYGNRATRIGGAVSNDITQGYGPEEYMIRKAMRGSYEVKVNFYGSGNPEVTGAVTLQATVITNFGRPNETRQTLTLRLTGNDDTYTVGKINF